MAISLHNKTASGLHSPVREGDPAGTHFVILVLAILVIMVGLYLIAMQTNTITRLPMTTVSEPMTIVPPSTE